MLPVQAPKDRKVKPDPRAKKELTDLLDLLDRPVLKATADLKV